MIPNDWIYLNAKTMMPF